MSVSVAAKGLQQFAEFADALPDLIQEAAYFALVDETRDAQPLIKRTMRKQVNFPSDYLNGQRLYVKKKPNRVTLESVIAGRDRPTSLARFAEGATVQNSRKRPIFVKVKAGQQRKLDRAFLINLRGGNVGLAIRLPQGQTPDNAYRPTQLTRRGGQEQNVWLLYGPSVDQVLQGVSSDVAPEIGEGLSRGFFRQLTRLTNRG